MVTTQQEKLLGEKEVVIERQNHELQGVKEDLAKKIEEVMLFTMPPQYSKNTITVYMNYCNIIAVEEAGRVTRRVKAKNGRESGTDKDQ